MNGARYLEEHWLQGLAREGISLTLKSDLRTSLEVQWLKIGVPMQGTCVRSLVCEDPTCCGATKVHAHNY